MLTHARADSADQDQMRAVIREADERFGTIHGVIHAAGFVGEESVRALQETGRAECERHFGPKVRGLMALQHVLGDRKLDFCLVQSSLSSVLGGLGLAAYAA